MAEISLKCRVTEYSLLDARSLYVRDHIPMLGSVTSSGGMFSGCQ